MLADELRKEHIGERLEGVKKKKPGLKRHVRMAETICAEMRRYAGGGQEHIAEKAAPSGAPAAPIRTLIEYTPEALEVSSGAGVKPLSSQQGSCVCNQKVHSHRLYDEKSLTGRFAPGSQLR